MTSTEILRRAVSLAFAPLLAGGLLLAQQPEPPYPSAPPAQSAAQPLSPQQLDTLVAPVALYPDRLLSQILAASTYPLEITEAAQWLQQNPGLQGQQLVDAARQQNWDPSVQALVVFPDVLQRLSSDVRWTTDLGNAFLAQQADVMNAVQRMRARASAAGKLKSNADQTVTTEMQGDQSAIEIQPANPEVVYVPYYNPQYIWGPPAYGYYPSWDYVDLGWGWGYGFGPGVYIGGFFGGLGWGGWGWGCNWFGHGLFLNPFFFSHWGFGWHGYGHGGVWAHDPGHRQGVAYSTRGLNARYGAASAASARSSFAASAGARYGSGARAGAAQAGGWSRFGQSRGTYSASPSTRGGYGASRPAYGASNGFRAAPSYGGNFGGSRGMSTYRPAPSYSAPTYRGGGSAYSAPRSSGGGRSYGGGGRSYSSGGGGRSSGGGAHFGGGGGGFHGGGGGGGGHHR